MSTPFFSFSPSPSSFSLFLLLSFPFSESARSLARIRESFRVSSRGVEDLDEPAEERNRPRKEDEREEDGK